MIVTTGKIIRVEAGDHVFEKTSEAPGRVRIWHSKTKRGFDLPGNPKAARALVEAYLRVVDEDVGYRKMGCE